MDRPRSAGTRGEHGLWSALAGAIATVAIWEIVGAAAFDSDISRWLTPANGLVIAALACAGLIAHESSSSMYRAPSCDQPLTATALAVEMIGIAARKVYGERIGLRSSLPRRCVHSRRFTEKGLVYS